MTRKPTQPHPGQAKQLFAEAYDAAAGLSSSLPRALGALANEAGRYRGRASPRTSAQLNGPSTTTERAVHLFSRLHGASLTA